MEALTVGWRTEQQVELLYILMLAVHILCQKNVNFLQLNYALSVTETTRGTLILYRI
jgi:hypothetical protein